jgi:uncharacterized protein
MANSAIASRLKTPGVYIEEIALFPPSVAQVPTAIPVFIGYTKNTQNAKGEDLLFKPVRIASMLEYANLFGNPKNEKGIEVEIGERVLSPTLSVPVVNKATINNRSPYWMFYALQWFYANGGGDCWVVSVGDDTMAIEFGDDTKGLKAGLNATDAVDEITLFVFPDAQGLTTSNDYYALYKEAMDKCAMLGDRFTIMDVYGDGNIETMRNANFGDINTMKYGAAYYPNIETTLDFHFDEAEVNLKGFVNDNLAAIKTTQSALYSQAKAAVRDLSLVLPPSPGIAGIYASVDFSRGVWKSPANVGLDYVIKPTVAITDKVQENLNIDVNSGKSVNAIRSFTGKGPGIVWGARTLAGNDNEWRYISVRRFFNMVEESVKKATVQFVFEPNDRNTWVRVRAMIENFLTLQWRAGALAGAVPEDAFYVKVGLGETMTALDILEGRMIVEIGMAVVRPAEFIILQFMHKMQES